MFRVKDGSDGILFQLETDARLDYEACHSFEVFVAKEEKSLLGVRDSQIQRSLFESGFNFLDKDFALYLETSDALHWWHLIAVRRGYAMQGRVAPQVDPDLVAGRTKNDKLLIL